MKLKRSRLLLLLWGWFSAGVGGVLSLPGQELDSGPQLVSRTGGGSPWKNPAELEAAATAGNPQACAQLGEQLLRGDDGQKQGTRALALLEQAARAGVASAAFRLGMLLDDGDEVAQDRVRALGYFRAAAAGDFALAYHNVGAAYAGAHGVKRNYAEALGWLILAGQRGVGSDSENAVRERITKLKHPEWIAAGEKRATEIDRELAAAPATSFLPPPGPLVYLGDSTSDSVPKERAGLITLDTLRVSASPAEPPPTATALKLTTPTGRLLRWPSLDALQRAADAGDPKALSALGQVLIEGKLAPENIERAVVLLERGAGAGSVDAAQQLADLYAKGGKVPADAAKAFCYNLQAARGGSVQAMFNTGALLSNGLGAPRDFTESLAWLIVAKQHGRDPGSEQRIRDYLARTAPAQIAIAEKRAGELQREIETVAIQGTPAPASPP